MAESLTKKRILRRTLNWTGNALALLGIVFVAFRLHNYGNTIDLTRFNVILCAAIAGFAMIYGISNLMLAAAWWNLLEKFGTNVPHYWAIKTYGISQLAKYVPGNIFHLAGRQAMGMSAGISGGMLAKSSVWELGLLAVTGALYGLLTLPLLFPAIPVFVSLAGFFSVSLIAYIGLRHTFGIHLSQTFTWYLCFLAISGTLFVGLLNLFVSNQTIDSLPLVSVCGAYIIAWLAGLVTPGAPAGIGVRELVLLFLLKGLVGEADLLLAVVVGRVITTCGDFLFFVAACLIPNQQETTPIR
jgi:glycosyltransferase 2 family protein